MHVQDATFRARLVAICLSGLCGPTAASDDCSVGDVLVDHWIGRARANVTAPPTTKATRREIEFRSTDQVVLKGYSYSPVPRENEALAKDFVLLLQGSASSAAQLAEAASGLALAARREIFVFEYRGYDSGSTVRPTAASIQQDIDAIIDTLAEGGRRGVVIGLSLGGVFAIQSLKHSNSGKSGHLRVLVDSVPAQVPWIPFLISCPRSLNPLDAATADVVPRLGVLYGTEDGWFKDSAARELMEKVKAGGGRVWVVKGRHVDLSLSGLAVRLPIYVDFVHARTP
jgi:hypothetical protein